MKKDTGLEIKRREGSVCGFYDGFRALFHRLCAAALAGIPTVNGCRGILGIVEDDPQ